MQPASGRLSAARGHALRGAVHGEVLCPGDFGYDDARAVHNGMIDRRPAAVVRVSGAADVAAVLEHARERGLSVSVRGGGHGVAGHAVAGDVVIDLSALSGVTIDPRARTAVVQGGATWRDVDLAAQAHGLAVPGGRVSHTGVAGLTLGGGEGWLSARHGLSADNLLGAEVVTADGRLVVADQANEPELFWALRGGGGNFGVVVSFTFRLHPVGPTVLGGLIGYRVSELPDVLAVVERLHAAGEGDFGGAVVLMSAPPAPFVPGNLVGQPILGVVPAWFGDLERGAELLRPLREAVRPLFDTGGPMPYVALQSMLDGGSPPGWRNRWAAEFVPELSPGLITALQDAIADRPSALTQIILAPLPEAVRRIPDDATAFPGRSGGRWLVHPVGIWASPDDDDANAAWVGELTSVIRDHGPTGSYLNLEDPGEGRVRWAMGEDRYRRLQRVKATWDPEDVFRHCAHIRLPTAG